MLPVLLRLGPVTIYSFGFFLFLGFSLFCFVVWKQTRVTGMSQEKVLDVMFLTIFLSLMAGRLGFVFSHWTQFSSDLLRLVLFMKYPGTSFPTMFLTATMVSAVAAKGSGLDVFWVWDLFGFAAAFMALLGNVGCFLDGCFLPSAYLPLLLAVLALGLVAVLVFMVRQFASQSILAETAQKRGFFFLCYLIFQLVSLLMTTWYTKNWWREGAYFMGLVAVAMIFLVRYRFLFTYVYSAVSQRRARSN